MENRSRSWKHLVLEIVQSLPRDFSLGDVLRHREYLSALYPKNRFVDAKVRQSLQILRNQGSIRFLGSGHYQRLDIPPAFSPLLDASNTHNYTGATQVSRVMLETWAQFNLYCLNCMADTLEPLPPNTPVKDFVCVTCSTDYQIKARNGRFGSRLTGGAYEPTLAALRACRLPEFVLVEFDSRYATVVFVDAIPGNAIDEERLVARRPLQPTARRAGWQGFTLRVDGLPRVRIVQPQGNDREIVRAEWAGIKNG